MFAKVIVDVPAKEANRPFDYRIPPELEGLVEVGSRVGVPFGPRILQGYVVEVSDHVDFDAARVKPIKELLDIEPPLLPEMIQLGKWMSERYLCHWITALHGMVPTALKGKEHKTISLDSPIESVFAQIKDEKQKQMVLWVSEHGEVTAEALLKQFPDGHNTLKTLLSQSILSETRQIIQPTNKKTTAYVYSTLTVEQLQNAVDELPVQATRQRELLQFFEREPGERVKLSELLSEMSVGRSTVNSLVEKGCLTMEQVEEYRDPYADRTFDSTSPLTLTPTQERAFSSISQALNDFRTESFLLHGITGSGKTEVYLQSIAHCLQLGRKAIVLVPEISLTPQMVERFKGRFGDRVAVLHSRLSAGERYDEWRKLYRGECDVAVGARSAVFAPISNIGLIIIDEEHESSYKQEDHPKYHARDIAIQRAETHQAAVLLGSATPSVETYTMAKTGKITLLSMSERVTGRALPEVHVVDMREELKSGHRAMFSRNLIEAIQKRLDREEQIVLFLNRRGFSTFVMCRSCGHTVQCHHCDISLTYHRVNRTMRCHYCGFATKEPTECPECQSEHIRFFGTGTQKVEEDLSQLFPGIRVIRMDVDTTTQKGSHEKWLKMFGQGKADVLLGTQMVAKGLDFPRVTLVGVIAADTILNLPDFRAAEKTFQLLTQVAGRAGRHELPGEVIIQTYSPEHYSIQFATEQSFDPFFQHEIKLRRDHRYPPYCRLALITLSHELLPVVAKAGQRVADSLKTNGEPGKVQVFGPVPSPLPKIKDRYRYQCMIKFKDGFSISALIKQATDVIEEMVKTDKLTFSVDIDPQVLM